MRPNKLLVAIALGAAVIVATTLLADSAPSDVDAAVETAGPTDEHVDKARIYLTECGRFVYLERCIDHLVQMLKIDPEAPPGLADKVRDVADLDDLRERVATVVASSIDEDLLDAAIAFYRSPEGSRFAKAELAMVDDAEQRGAALGLELARAVLRGEPIPPPEPMPVEPTAREAQVLTLFEQTRQRDACALLVPRLQEWVRSMGGTDAGLTEAFAAALSAERLLAIQFDVALEHCDAAMLDHAIAFFGSDEGRRLVDAALHLLPDAMRIGEAWAKETLAVASARLR